MMGQVGDTMLLLKCSNVINDAVFVIGRIMRRSSGENHYENMPIQIYRKFHLQKLKNFR